MPDDSNSNGNGNNNEDGLDIPGYLKISAEARREGWKNWKGFATPPAPTATEHSRELREAGLKMRNEQRRIRLEKFLGARAQREQASAIPKSKRRWDPIQCRFVGED